MTAVPSETPPPPSEPSPEPAPATPVRLPEALIHDVAELLRREGDLLAGDGVPALRSLRGRRVLIVVDSDHSRADLKRIKRFVKEVKPAIIAVGAGAADLVISRGHRPDVVVVDDTVPSSKVLKAAREVVTIGVAGTGPATVRLETSLDAAAVAVLLAHAAGAPLTGAVGLPTTLGAQLDSHATGTFVARTVSASTLVDAAAIAQLYDGKVRPRHVIAALVLGVIAVVAAIATTDVGQDWWHQSTDWVQEQVQ